MALKGGREGGAGSGRPSFQEECMKVRTLEPCHTEALRFLSWVGRDILCLDKTVHHPWAWLNLQVANSGSGLQARLLLLESKRRVLFRELFITRSLCPHPSTDPFQKKEMRHKLEEVWIMIVAVYLDLQNTQNNGPCTAYTLYFRMLGHYFGHFGGPGKIIWL